MHLLLDKFEDEYKTLCNKQRFNYLLALGSSVATWGLAYKFRMKFSSFFVATAFAYFATKTTLDSLVGRRMQKGLNRFAGNMALNYPEVKFSRVVYTKSEEIKKEKLI